ncbi:MAG: PIG-L family deacetylase [Isosphaeraceae bacterium]|nr:PIG-L family deacetylase [Isosphaeraceae bacterium]
MANRVLVIAPHPDDESIGCGGIIGLHRRLGDRVRAVFLTSGERGLSALPVAVAQSTREAEARAAAEVLGIEHLDFLRLPDLGLLETICPGGQQLGAILAAWMPDVIYLPHAEESHPDHRAALPIVRGALAQAPGRAQRPSLWAYEVWSPLVRYDRVEDISPVIHQKLRAIRCHQSQIREYRHDHAARGLARYRGVMAACGRYAEVFRALDLSALRGACRDALWLCRTTPHLRRLRRVASRLRGPRRRALAPSEAPVDSAGGSIP